MKLVPLFLLVIALQIMSCENKKKTSDTGTTGKEKTDTKKKDDAVTDEQAVKDSLEKMTPLSLEKFSALVPEQLMGASRSNNNVSAAMGANLATADYVLNDSTTIDLSIYDCAGPGGAGIYSTQYQSMINSPQESDEEYTKTTDLMGGKAYEHCEKATNNCSLTWFARDRFLVILEGEHVRPDILKQAARALNIK